MPYLICNNCEIYYEIDADFDFSDFNTCENCGENLKYYDNFDEYYEEKDFNPVYEKKTDVDNFDIENENSNYDKIAIVGFILAIIGLFVFMLAYAWPFLFVSQSLQNFQNPNNMLNFFVQIILIYFIAIVIMVAGVLIYIYGKRKGKNQESIIKTEGRKKNIKASIKKGESIADYFKNLPEGYFILNNLKIPAKRIKLDHVVIGPKGIFLIHLMKLQGHYIINENEWLNDKGSMSKKALENPNQRVKLNAIELKRFLESKNLNTDYVLINSIVAFKGNNFKVRKMPRTYNVMNVREMSSFILNSKRKMDVGTVTEAVILLERYSSDVMRS